MPKSNNKWGGIPNPDNQNPDKSKARQLKSRQVKIPTN